MASDTSTKVVTGKVRLSYVHLFEPYTPNEDSPEKYSCVILIPKSDKKTLADLDRAIKNAVENGKDRVFKGKVPANITTTLHDGDEEADLDRNPEYAGHMYMSVSSKTKPGVVDKSLNEVIDPSEVYSGCYARVSIGAFAYNVSGNRGVSFGLNHVQKVADGDFLGGRTRASDDFTALDDEDDDLL